ncbi:AIPR family protein [Parachitinimonas caeni]|uniref:AIPR family protein n=1 Tax=Parachitinimonas caeni TaxID=3031301 RepID=A0ABT7E0Y3_9NEIS|nr:AIPR family protein [Parachitinimonas caeni]MDK2125970.1 AIPR family protein [Parachitinimonas caeni]
MSHILSKRISTHIENSIREHLFLDDANQSAKINSRGLVAICLASLASTTYSELKSYIIDGSGDNGIDGVFYDHPRNNLFVVQAKWSERGSSTIDTGDLRKFIAGTYDLLNEDWGKFNDRLRYISSSISQSLRNDPKITLVAAFNSDNPISPDCQKIIEEFLKENNTDSQEVVTFIQFNLTKIVRAIKTINSAEKPDLEVVLLDWGQQTTPYYAIYGKIPCADIAEWYNKFGNLLFSENIRNTLSESEVNNQIEQELLTNPSDFWYLNNGITVIADRITRKALGLGEGRESSYWKIDNAKIVNGAQTTGSIAKSYQRNQSKVKQAYIQIKIISLDNAPGNIAARITVATNTQNKVEPKDFLALDPIQDSLSESFKSIGIQYSYKRGDSIIDPKNGLDIQDLAITLALYSESIANVTTAKRNAGSLTDRNGYYEKIFTGQIDVKKAWEKVKIWRQTSDLLATISKSTTGRDSQLTIHGNRFIEHLVLTLDLPSNSKLLNIIIRLIMSIISESYGNECYLAVLFKNTRKCEFIKDKLLIQLLEALNSKS